MIKTIIQDGSIRLVCEGDKIELAYEYLKLGEALLKKISPNTKELYAMYMTISVLFKMYGKKVLKESEFIKSDNPNIDELLQELINDL